MQRFLSGLAATGLAFATMSQAQTPPLTPAATPAPAPRYSTSDTPIGVLVADPAAKAVLDKYIPGMTGSNKQVEMIKRVTLKSIQGYALAAMPDALLAKIDAELAMLTPSPEAFKAVGVTMVAASTTDEARVRPYTLPDPLKMQDGTPVRTPVDWRAKRRPELLELFRSVQYGRAPGRPAQQRFEVFDTGTPALGGTAVRRQAYIHLSRDPLWPKIQVLEYLPAKSKGKAPVFLMIGFETPSQMFADPGVRPGLVWDTTSGKRVPATGTGGSGMGRFDAEARRFIDAGFGIVTFYYGDVEPDFSSGYPHGIRARYDGPQRAPDAWGAISAWAWETSRVMDFLETERGVDARRVAVFGASRLGKTALWAGAQDQRFAAVVASISGKLGATLSRRNFGSTIGIEDDGAFWVARNMERYAGKEADLPIDQHELLALIAPRPLLLQTGRHDLSADPKGEFLSARAATPVYRLLGKQGISDSATWPLAAPLDSDIGYIQFDGGHGLGAKEYAFFRAFLTKYMMSAPAP